MMGDGRGRCERPNGGTDAVDLDGGPDADEFYRLLSSSPRRRILYFLEEHAEASVEELSDVLVGWKAVDDGAPVVGRKERNRIRITLHHVHLPMLDSVGLLNYDGAAREASIEPLPEPLSEILHHARTYDASESGESSESTTPTT